jgi:tetratricopeptide (TPR) repeat protein
VHYRRGELAEMLGYEDDAEIEYRATVAHSPTHLPALEALARLALYRGDVTAAIAALRGVLDLLPLDDVERITTMRQQLGELCQRAGDAAAARGYLELVLVEDPTRPAALEPLAELYASAGQWDKTINILQRLSYVVASPEKRADVLYRIGEIHRLRLGDDDRASEAYLKAIDLDEHHAPTLRRLIDYYWAQGDDAGLLELGDELDGRGALIHPDTPVDTLARVAVAAARGGDVGRASALVRGLGDAAVGALAMALADAAARAPSTIDLIAAAARALCAPPGPSIDAVRAVLAMRASKDERSAKLAAEL